MKKMSKKENKEKVRRIMSVADEVMRVMFPLIEKNKLEVREISFVFAMLLDHLFWMVKRKSGKSSTVVKTIIMGWINYSLDTINEMKEEDEREHEKEA